MMIDVLLVSGLMRLLRKRGKTGTERQISGSDINVKKKCSHLRDLHTVLTYLIES